MRLLVFLLIFALCLGGLVGMLVQADTGYVMFKYGDHVVETSLWVALAGLVILYLVAWLIVSFFARVGQGRVGMLNWSRGRRVRTAREQTLRGLLLLLEGRWTAARKLLAGSAERSQTPLINYLNAARAAHHEGDNNGRDEYLRLAQESTPGAKFAVGVTQAELQKSAGEWEQCLATLLKLREVSQRHPALLKMLIDCHLELGDFEALQDILPVARKAEAIDARRQQELQRVAALGLLATSDNPTATLKNLPRALRKEADMTRAGAERLIELGECDSALELMVDTLVEEWRPELVRLLGTTKCQDPQRQLTACKRWVKERPNDPELLLALGRVSLMNSDWPGAREYFEAALRLAKRPDIYGELGRLCASMGDDKHAAEYLVNALVDLPELPQPEAAAKPAVVAKEAKEAKAAAS